MGAAQRIVAPTMTGVAKRVVPADLWATVSDAYLVVRDWVGVLDEAVFRTPSVLDGWTVGDLAAHTSRSASTLPGLGVAARGTTPLSVADYIARYAAGGAAVADRGRSAVGGADRTVEDVVTAMTEGLAAASEVVNGWAGDPVIAGAVGPIRASDYVVTRLLEVAVHADDLARSVPDVPPPAVPKPATRLAVRTLLDVLAERHPGRSVEVRVPPFAAVQAVEGPRHTRGTPSNVVEAAPVTWLRLASGRLSWADARGSGALTASGERSDLSAFLPLL